MADAAGMRLSLFTLVHQMWVFVACVNLKLRFERLTWAVTIHIWYISVQKVKYSYYLNDYQFTYLAMNVIIYYYY